MAFPSKLKQLMMFNNGTAFIGETVSITIPKLVRKLEDYRGGGMGRPVKVDMGGEALEMEAVYVITGIDDRGKVFFPDGTPRQIDFAIDLLRVDSDVA